MNIIELYILDIGYIKSFHEKECFTYTVSTLLNGLYQTS